MEECADGETTSLQTGTAQARGGGKNLEPGDVSLEAVVAAGAAVAAEDAAAEGLEDLAAAEDAVAAGAVAVAAEDAVAAGAVAAAAEAVVAAGVEVEADDEPRLEAPPAPPQV